MLGLLIKSLLHFEDRQEFMQRKARSLLVKFEVVLFVPATSFALAVVALLS